MQPALKEASPIRLPLDSIKKEDLKAVFEILMIEAEMRTIQDCNTLSKIILKLSPIKNMNDITAVFHACKTMYLAKYKPKSFVYQRREETEAFYLILNGKIGIYERNKTETVIVLSEGNCFGHIYSWKVDLLPLTFDEVLLAVMPKQKSKSIASIINQQKQQILKHVLEAGIIKKQISETSLPEIGRMLQLHHLTHRSTILKAGQVAKGLYYLMKGTVKQLLKVTKEIHLKNPQLKQQSNLVITRYTSQDYFPKQKQHTESQFTYVTEGRCQIIFIPSKIVKMFDFNSSLPALNLLTKEECIAQRQKLTEWQKYKENIMKKVVKQAKIMAGK